MDINMEDVGRVPEPSKLSPVSEPASIPTLDGWIESLMNCKQLAEVDVQRLCEKVCSDSSTRSGGALRYHVEEIRFNLDISRQGMSCMKSQTSNQ